MISWHYKMTGPHKYDQNKLVDGSDIKKKRTSLAYNHVTILLKIYILADNLAFF